MKRIRLALSSFAVLTLAACAPLQVRTGYNQQAPAYGYGPYGYASYYGHGHLGHGRFGHRSFGHGHFGHGYLGHGYGPYYGSSRVR